MRNAIACAGALIQDGKILLGKRNAKCPFYPGIWDLPGGHAEANETLEQTLKRELNEELGIDQISIEQLSILRIINNEEELTLYVYLVTRWSGEPFNTSLAEHDELGWFALEEAASLTSSLKEYQAIWMLLQQHLLGKSSTLKPISQF